MVFFKFNSNEFKDLVHEVLLVEVTEAVDEYDYQLDKGINESVIKSAIVKALISLVVVQSQIDTRFDHHVAESEKHVLISRNLSAQLSEVVVYFCLLDFSVFNVEEVYPLEEVLVQTSLKGS